MAETTDIAGLRAAGRDGWVKAAVPVLVDAVLEKSSRDGRSYLEVQLCDARDRLVLRVWPDAALFDAAASLASGACLQLEGEFHVHPTFGLEARGWKFRALEGGEKEEFLAGPADLRARQQEDYALIEAAVAGLKDPRLQALGAAFLEKWGTRFRRTAAARFFHHARRGGLVEHVAQMMRYAGAVCSANPKLNRDLLVSGVLFHDCGKLWENSVEEGGFNMPFDERGELLGHINIGIELVNSLWKTLPLEGWEDLTPKSEDVRLHLLHLVASHHGELQFGSPIPPKTPEAIALHYIDNLDAKLEMLARGYEGGASVGERIYDKVKPLNVRPVEPLPAHEA
ncbi:MAG: HD domain-containing protein [Chthoniobacterales bacterium]|nr:HD domain-containing protein [Chthoniobacterales bacterium]